MTAIIPPPRPRHVVYGELMAQRHHWSMLVDVATEWLSWQLPLPIIIRGNEVVVSHRDLPPEYRREMEDCKERIFALQQEYDSLVPSDPRSPLR